MIETTQPPKKDSVKKKGNKKLKLLKCYLGVLITLLQIKMQYDDGHNIDHPQKKKS